ncbi:hypothetical protein NRI_0914 [Neorickettsia risticii str. Illinois]|uniref:Uncharacterized protein n=1 Tax=Neorickettsia risticii (strain Illinois) TaxID=434131 RepID=C6V662_NEORI|nr:hypothetical protein NRI_0914 [Neorickettsia risticii str. Illinois]
MNVIEVLLNRNQSMRTRKYGAEHKCSLVADVTETAAK